MKSRIWRLAGVGLLCLSIGAPALAEGGPQDQEQRSGNPNGGRPQGQPQAPQQQPQNRPQPGNQPQQHPQNNNQGHWQNRQNEGRPAMQQAPQQVPQHVNSLPIQGKPDTVRQTQEPIRGNYPDLQRNNNQHWQAGAGAPRPGNDNRPPAGHGNGWGSGPQFRPGQTVDRFPGRYDRVPYRGTDYFFSDGYWYRPQGPRYVVVAPPYGVRTRYLPDYAQQVLIGGAVLFLAAGTYYQYMDNTQDYVVVTPPQQAQPVYQQQPAYQVPPGTPYDVTFYPANGQPPQQIAQDQYDCQRWGAQQSGFDPAGASYAPAPEVVNVYRQNMANCLVSRGYSVN